MGFSSLGGYKLTTVDGKIAYYKESEGADSATPFSQGCKLLWADHEVESQEKGTFINVDLSGYSKVIVSLDYSRGGGAPYTRYLLDVGGTYKIWGVNASGSANYRTLTISTSGISIDAFTSYNRALLSEVYGWADSETDNDFSYSGNYLGTFISQNTYTFDTSLVGDSCFVTLMHYISSNSTAAQITSYENCDVELVQNIYQNNFCVYVYRITNIVDDSTISHGGTRPITIFK